jgi:AcrR family transcriptional regulator
VTGLRERKKLETRQHIADTAARLFADHGFDAVTVDEVAEAANVSKKTVFNYFPTKEDLVFHRTEERRESLLHAVRERAPGQSLTDAFRTRSLDFLDHVRSGSPVLRQGIVASLISSSPSLERRARELHFQNVRLVAHELAALTGAEENAPMPLVVAQSLLGAHHALARECERLLAEGKTPDEVADAVEPEVHRVFDLLAGGIQDYARIP